MDDNKILPVDDETEDGEEAEIYTLVDENGVEFQFECVAKYDEGETHYFAMLPIDGENNEEYVILKLEKSEDGEDTLVSVDDDDEFDKISEVFDDLFFSDVDYDAESETK